MFEFNPLSNSMVLLAIPAPPKKTYVTHFRLCLSQWLIPGSSVRVCIEGDLRGKYFEKAPKPSR